MKTLAIGRTTSGAFWVYMFDTWEEALVFVDTAKSTPLPNHEVFDMEWDLLHIEPTMVAQAIAELKGVV